MEQFGLNVNSLILLDATMYYKYILFLSRVEYDFFDILQDEDVRQGLKKFSNWPTYPQLYVDGSLIGGLDIIKVSQARIK